MKKASWALLILLLIFLFVLLGVLIGRATPGKNTVISYRPASNDSTSASDDTESAVTADGKIDINRATVKELMLLPDIGEVLAVRIINYRTENGPFVSVDELVLVKGIGESLLESIRELVTVGG